MINKNININSSIDSVKSFDRVQLFTNKIIKLDSDIIGVYIDKSIDMILIIYAILLSGKIYLPLDKSYPVDKIKYYIEQSNCKYVITDSKNIFNNLKDLTVIEIDNLLNNDHSLISDVKYIFNPISYILYTSGTTGNPKGTLNKFSSLKNHMQWLIETFQFDKNDIILQKTPINFDASTWEIYLPLFNDMKMFVCNNEDYKNPETLAKTIIKNKINIIQIVPALGFYLFNEIKKIDSDYKLKYVFCGGEALSFKLAKKLSEISLNVVNLYGPSECCCNSIFYQYKSGDENKYNSLYCPIGNPILNTDIKLINNNIEDNDEGELYISGECVGLGYINNKILTNEKFINLNNKVFYKTGDIVYFNKDRTLTFKNRIDTEVKLNGQRIDLNEIKEVIYLHPLVLECEIIIKNNVMICIVTPKLIDINILNNICIDKLESFKIPSIFKCYEEIPKLDNGKLDLLSVTKDFDYLFEDNDEDYDEIEVQLVNLISELTNVNKKNISKDLDLKCIGLDSLKTTILSNKIEQNFKIQIPYNQCNNINNISNFIKRNNVINNSNNAHNKNVTFINLLNDIIDKSNKIIAFHSSLIDFNLDLYALKPLLKNLIQTKCDQGYTFLFPTFNYSFCSNSFYHYKYSNSEVGVLGEWMLELKDSVRTNNPIFSWVVIGNKSEELLKCDNTNCFSKNTIFDYLYNKNTSYILLGCKHFTQLHYCEEIANVKWRFQKSFKGIVNFNNLNEEYEIKMFCRRLDCKSNLGFSYFDLINKHINKINFNNTLIYTFETKNICNILLDNLYKNNLLPF